MSPGDPVDPDVQDQPNPDHEYDLSAWSSEARESLEFLVSDAGMPVHWRGSTLVVPARQDEGVAGLISFLESEPAPISDPEHESRAKRTGGPFRLPPPPDPQWNPNAPAGWHSRPDRAVGWGWWDGNRWADDGGGGPSPEYATEPGWYPDPWERSPDRWWDGYSWTGHVADREEERPWLPPKHDHDARAVRGIGLVFVGIVASAVVSIALAVVLLLAGGRHHTLVLETIPQFGLWATLFGACVLAVRRYGDGSLRQLGLDRLRRKDIPVGLLGAYIGRTAAGVIGVLLVPLLPNKLVRNTSFLNELQGSTLTLIVVGAIIVVGAPFFEELFFRGLAQAAFTRRWGDRVGIFAQAGVFALVHYQVGMGLAETLLTFATIGSFGIVLGVLRAHYQRLGPGMVAHAAFNVVAVITALALN